MDLKSIEGVEIFSVGTWNGDTYTQVDLDEMVQAFHFNRETLLPPLKLGHTEKQKILQSDGLPAAGWIGNLYTKGGKLIADFIDIPNKIYDLLVSKAYRKVSAEIFWNADINGKKFPRMLAAVALLGADMPAVSNLKDILSIHAHALAEFIKNYASETNDIMIKQYSHDMGDQMNEQELKDLQAKKEELSNQIKTYESNLSEKDAVISEKEQELAELKEFKAQAEAKALEAAKALEESKLEATITELQSEKMVSAAMRPYIKALLSEDKKEYSFKLKEDSEVKFSKPELLKHVLKLFAEASKVNFVESSEDVESTNAKDETALNQEITKYATEHNVSYTAAYKAVLKK